MGLLENRVALVMGGASGLGEAISHRFAAEGAAVVVADVDGNGAERVAREIQATGASAVGAPCDVTNRADVETTIEVARAMGPLRVLVLSAAIESFKAVVELGDDEWQRVLDVNLKGPFLCMRAAIPAMVANGGGSVIALGSTLGLIVAPGHPAYCASKGALVNLCKQAAIEHAPDNVRVNVLAPSATDTGLFMRVSGGAPDPDFVRARVAAGMPMKRLARAGEVCDAAVFLASELSTYLSGAVVPLDGGLAARRM
ncbi:MAG TPA: SDR family NAD(P)-dependent oxidoreductase [Acidimicrobiia bacterium]|nr:SDR family NAD(P)-dependent oxidoreductase [Acidimicrobiia bacterium]